MWIFQTIGECFLTVSAITLFMCGVIVFFGIGFKIGEFLWERVIN